MKSRQLKLNENEIEIPSGHGYCRRCQKIKASTEFGKATDNDLDSNGLLSVCKKCLDEVYAKILLSENNNIEKTVLKLCRKLNIRFDKRGIDSALVHIQSKNSDPMKLFGLYRAKILVLLRENVNDTNVDLTYQYENDNKNIPVDDSKFESEGFMNMDELRKFWGESFEPEEINKLEEKFADYSQTNSIDTHPERVLLKFICIKEYDIEKAIISGGSTASLMKEYQSLLNNAGISPASVSASAVGKSQETWGSFIKTIEETEPAEYFKDDNLFKDYDNIEKIWLKYIVRPIKNFITGSRDFNVEDIESDYEEEESEDVEITPALEYKPEE